MENSEEKIKAIYNWLDVDNQQECGNEIVRLQVLEDLFNKVHDKVQEILEASPVPKSEWLATSIDNKLLAIENLIKSRLS